MKLFKIMLALKLLAFILVMPAAGQYYGGWVKSHGHSGSADGGRITNFSLLGNELIAGSVTVNQGMIVKTPFAVSTTTAKNTAFAISVASNSTYALTISTPGANSGSYVLSISTSGRIISQAPNIVYSANTDIGGIAQTAANACSSTHTITLSGGTGITFLWTFAWANDTNIKNNFAFYKIDGGAPVTCYFQTNAAGNLEYTGTCFARTAILPAGIHTLCYGFFVNGGTAAIVAAIGGAITREE